MRVFENKMLRRIFGPKRDEVTGEWRRLIMGSLMPCSPHKTEMGGACNMYGAEERCIQGFRGEI
jgi:hypothetical protein